jgi:hypothetical protein
VGVERLEDRMLLATFADTAIPTLTLTLAANDAVGIVADASTDTHTDAKSQYTDSGVRTSTLHSNADIHTGAHHRERQSHDDAYCHANCNTDSDAHQA